MRTYPASSNAVAAFDSVGAAIAQVCPTVPNSASAQPARNAASFSLGSVFDGCADDPARRRQRLRTFAIAAAGTAVAMALVVAAHWGWIEIAAGLVLGATTWLRLARQAAR